MRKMLLAAALLLLELHAPSSNQIIWVNPAEIVSVREPRPTAREHWAPGVHCVLIMANNNFISVRETCREVLRQPPK